MPPSDTDLSQATQGASPASQVVPDVVPSSQPDITSQQPATPPSPGWRDQLQTEFGIDTKSWDSDDRVVDLLRYVRDQSAQQQQLAAYGQRYLSQAEQYEKWLAEQQQAKQPAPASEPASKPYWPEPPQWNPADEQYLARDAEGRVVATNGNPLLVDKYNAMQQWRKDRLDALLRDPVEAQWSGIEQRLNKMFEERGFISRKDIDAQKESEFAQSFLLAHRGWLYQNDPNGQPITDQLGQPVFSQAGLHFTRVVQQLQQAGVANPAVQADIALQLTAAQFQGNGQQAPAPQTTATPGVDPKERFLSGAGHSPNRSGTISQSAMPHVPQNGSMTFREMLREDARLAGIH